MANTKLPTYSIDGPAARKTLKRFGWSIRKFAELMGVSERTIRLYFDKCEIPTHRKAKFMSSLNYVKHNPM